MDEGKIWLGIWDESLHEFIPDGLCILNLLSSSLVCCLKSVVRYLTPPSGGHGDHFGDISTSILRRSLHPPATIPLPRTLVSHQRIY